MSGYSQLTESEKRYVKHHPINAYKIAECKNMAVSETKRRFGYNGRNDKSDAFSHCYWSALLSREIGYQQTIQFTTLHESQPGNDLKEKSMDLYNNRAGADIGRNGGANEMLALKCMEALKRGKLIYY